MCVCVCMCACRSMIVCVCMNACCVVIMQDKFNGSANYSMSITATSAQLPLNTKFFLPHGSA